MASWAIYQASKQQQPTPVLRVDMDIIGDVAVILAVMVAHGLQNKSTK